LISTAEKPLKNGVEFCGDLLCLFQVFEPESPIDVGAQQVWVAGKISVGTGENRAVSYKLLAPIVNLPKSGAQAKLGFVIYH
jgi:hypothetical protein